jgi:hypothetical protein
MAEFPTIPSISKKSHRPMAIFGRTTANFKSAPECLFEGDETKARAARDIPFRAVRHPGDVRPRKGDKPS